MANDGRFAAISYEERIDLWLGDGDGRNGRVVATPNRARVYDSSAMALSWAGDRLVYLGRDDASATVLASRLDGSAPEELLREAGGAAITSDGRTLIYLSLTERNLGWIWKANRTTGRPEPLVSDVSMWPRLTPDNQVVFLGRGLEIVSIADGARRRIADMDARAPDVSPDGRLLAFITLSAANELEIVVCDLTDCGNQRRFRPPGLADPISRPSAVRFTKDQLAIAYVNTDVPANIWLQPLDGSAPRPLTEFSDDLGIFDFAWSADGGRLAIARGRVSTDIVLFSPPRPQ